MVRLVELINQVVSEEELHEKVADHAREGTLEIAGAPVRRKVRLGTMLIEIGVVDFDGLHSALEKQRDINRRVGEVLVEEGLIQPQDLEEALRIQYQLNENLPAG